MVTLQICCLLVFVASIGREEDLGQMMRYNSFLIKFNVLYLGGLFLTLLFLSSIMFRARLEWNTSWMWATKYLNGNYIAAIYVIVLLVSIISYAYALWKTWQLTKCDTVINKRRVLAFGWLIGAPLLVASNPLFFISVMRLVTDRLFIS